MPPTFTAPCEKCGKDRAYEEFFRERRVAESDRAARTGEVRRVQEYRFRCTGCGSLEEKVLDTSGVLHKWTGNRHVTMKVE
ncbi:MAG TPA: hypothetical protein VNZ52_11185 [Candidatus Thermoplasmatota archaeon]|nr:hypothetical protein [Candidatus Thermoplasmatota archaeon]